MENSRPIFVKMVPGSERRIYAEARTGEWGPPCAGITIAGLTAEMWVALEVLHPAYQITDGEPPLLESGHHQQEIWTTPAFNLCSPRRSHTCVVNPVELVQSGVHGLLERFLKERSRESFLRLREAVAASPDYAPYGDSPKRILSIVGDGSYEKARSALLSLMGGWLLNPGIHTMLAFTLFPTPVHQPSLTKDAPFDVCESHLEDSFYNSWDKIKHNLVLGWVDLASKSGSHGLGLFSDHTTSYTFGSDFPLGLTIQYAGKGLWARDYRCDGPTEVRYALVPHTGGWNAANLPALSASWQEPAIGALTGGGPARARSLIDPGDSGWLVPAMFERDNSIFVRLFNATGDSSARKLKLGFEADLVELVELDGRVIRELSVREDRSLELDIPQLGFRTLRFSKIHPPQEMQR